MVLCLGQKLSIWGHSLVPKILSQLSTSVNWLLLEELMEKATATHFSSLAWKIPWAEEPGLLQSMWLRRVGHDWATSLSLSCIGERNGSPLQCSYLENPRDGRAWWAAICGVTQSQTRLKRLSSSSSSGGTQRILSLRFSIGWPFGCV